MAIEFNNDLEELERLLNADPQCSYLEQLGADIELNEMTDATDPVIHAPEAVLAPLEDVHCPEEASNVLDESVLQTPHLDLSSTSESGRSALYYVLSQYNFWNLSRDQ